MSANNYILIKETKKNFTVGVYDADTHYQQEKLGSLTDFKSACELAQNYMDEQPYFDSVEYGIRFKFLANSI